MSNWTPEVTVTYTSDEGEEITFTRTLTPEGLADVLSAMDDGAADE
ncbi:hypothetical protein ACFWMJ_23415 [Streptomyces hawaiiensis]